MYLGREGESYAKQMIDQKHESSGVETLVSNKSLFSNKLISLERQTNNFPVNNSVARVLNVNYNINFLKKLMLRCVCFSGDAKATRDTCALLTRREVNMAGNRPSAFSLHVMDREAVKVHNHAKKKEANIQPS